ncbi:hypothetical protein [Flavilitoribacter nigricans]|uniref:Uncharacterized protein n=1 Tax=Flavilitoribacter nigricans (strain ATCC 23147 / DSM 23189 / NBRC 102662 / NCIMB 1420 / SS-2) TaxID=1122177 RepID=A0A2D0NF00_FLAN2|nr:hypothetical protein [Flavilitoribacter nigricans]PHN06950.1 hypothetical protein CRP01_09040 [Flavilitoribacter nigricans DSM 23189 = NBRC 102662]
MKNSEAIIEVLNGDLRVDDLNPSQVDYYKRVRVTFDLICEGNPSKYVSGVLEKEFGLSRTQAWRTIRETELIFSKMQQVDKMVHRNIAAEMAKKAYRKADIQNDPKAMVAATHALVKAYGLDQHDPDTPDFEKLTAHTYIILPPANAPKLGEVNGGLIDLNQAPKPVTIDAQYEELDTDAGAGS